MPEIWLPYGDLEVAIELKSENLSEVAEPKVDHLPDEKAVELLSSVKGIEPIIIADVKPATLRALSTLLDLSDGKEVEVRCEASKLSHVRRVCEGKTSRLHAIGKPDTPVELDRGLKLLIPKLLTEGGNKLLVTQTSLDPMFGFLGGPASIFNILGVDALKQIFLRWNKQPQPGTSNDLSNLADSLDNSVKDLTSVEILSDGGSFSQIYVGSIHECHSKASESLRKSVTWKPTSKAKVVVASPGHRPHDSTFSSSVRSVWNVIGSLRENGSLILVCECSEGLGSTGLDLYLSGRLTLEELEKGRYVEGAEDVYYVRKLSTLNLTVVSTLSNYYVEKRLGFRSSRRASEALLSALETQGTRAKTLVFPRASSTLTALEAPH